MSRSVVFNESVMINNSLSTDAIPGGCNKEQQYVSVQVEHVDDQETEIVDNDVYDNVQHSILFCSHKMNLLHITEQKGVVEL